MNPDNIQTITHKIEATVTKLRKFIRTVETSSSYSLDRISDALVKIKNLAENDIDEMKEIVRAIKQSYDSLLGKRLDHTLYFLENAEYNLNYLVARMEPDARSPAVAPFTNMV